MQRIVVDPIDLNDKWVNVNVSDVITGDVINSGLTWIWEKDPWSFSNSPCGTVIISSRSVVFREGIGYRKYHTNDDSNNSTKQNWEQSETIKRTRSRKQNYLTVLGALDNILLTCIFSPWNCNLALGWQIGRVLPCIGWEQTLQWRQQPSYPCNSLQLAL